MPIHKWMFFWKTSCFNLSVPVHTSPGFVAAIYWQESSSLLGHLFWIFAADFRCSALKPTDISQTGLPLILSRGESCQAHQVVAQNRWPDISFKAIKPFPICLRCAKGSFQFWDIPFFNKKTGDESASLTAQVNLVTVLHLTKPLDDNVGILSK